MCLAVIPQYLHFYEHRLETFKNWPGTQTPESLAKAGFFYLQDNDEVQCFFCRIRIHKWEPADDPVSEHLRWSKHCAFVDLTSDVQKARDELNMCLNILKTIIHLFE